MLFDRNKYKKNDVFLDVKAIKNTAPDEYCMIYTIPLKFEFRPDLIAYTLYNDVSMAEYLAIINNIDNSPEGFKKGLKIRCILPQYKETL